MLLVFSDYDTSSLQKSCVWIHFDNPTPTTPKKQRDMKKIQYEVVLNKCHHNASSYSVGVTVDFLKGNNIRVIESTHLIY